MCNCKAYVTLQHAKMIQGYLEIGFLQRYQGFPGISAGKESTCNAGDPGLIPALGRSTGEGIGYPPQYSWASLVAQLVKNLPAMRETWVQSLGWEEDPLHPLQYFCLENSMDYPRGCKELDTTEQLSRSLCQFPYQPF